MVILLYLRLCLESNKRIHFISIPKLKCFKHSISLFHIIKSIYESEIVKMGKLDVFKHAWDDFCLLICTCFYQVLGFGDYIEEVYAAYEQHKMETVVCLILMPCACWSE